MHDMWPGAVLCVNVCVFTHLPDYHLTYLWTGNTCFKMSSQFSNFINTKTHQHTSSLLFSESWCRRFWK